MDCLGTLNLLKFKLLKEKEALRTAVKPLEAALKYKITNYFIISLSRLERLPQLSKNNFPRWSLLIYSFCYAKSASCIADCREYRRKLMMLR